MTCSRIMSGLAVCGNVLPSWLPVRTISLRCLQCCFQCLLYPGYYWRSGKWPFSKIFFFDGDARFVPFLTVICLILNHSDARPIFGNTFCIFMNRKWLLFWRERKVADSSLKHLLCVNRWLVFCNKYLPPIFKNPKQQWVVLWYCGF